MASRASSPARGKRKVSPEGRLSPQEYADPRAMSAFCMGHLLVQAQLRLAGVAWRGLLEHSHRKHWHERYGLGPDGLEQLDSAQHEAWAGLLREEHFEPYDPGSSLVVLSGVRAFDASSAWVSCGGPHAQVM